MYSYIALTTIPRISTPVVSFGNVTTHNLTLTLLIYLLMYPRPTKRNCQLGGAL